MSTHQNTEHHSSSPSASDQPTDEARTRSVQFAHFLDHKLGEFEHWLRELLDICENSLCQFNAEMTKAQTNESQTKNYARKEDSLARGGRQLNYVLSALAAGAQSLKDILPIVLQTPVTWTNLARIQHMEFFRGIRNAMTHDGHPVVNTWMDGKFYVGADFERVGDRGQAIVVERPTQDIATVSIEFTVDYVREIRSFLRTVKNTQHFAEPLYRADFYRSVAQHPAMPAFAREMVSQSKDLDQPLHFTSNVIEDVRKRLMDLEMYANFRLRDFGNT